MKLVKFFAATIAAVAMFAACETPETNKGGEVIIQEFVNVYVDINETDWEKCGVWAWNLANISENYTGGTWPGQQLTQKETIDGVEYYVWTECPKELVGTEIGFIVNNFPADDSEKQQTADIKLPVADGVKVSVATNDEGGYIILINGEEFTPEEPEEKFVEELLEGEHTFGICGTLTNWNSPINEGEEPVADIPMALVDGWYTATIECAADAQFKVRADGKWDYSFGYNVTEEAALAPVDGTEFIASFNGQDNNIIVADAASYKVEFQIAEVEEEYVGKIKLTKLAAENEGTDNEGTDNEGTDNEGTPAEGTPAE